MFKGLLQMHDWNLKAVFTPGRIYYRPLLSLSFILDKEFWFLNEKVMHLENVVLHLVNVVLVYYLALMLLPDNENEVSMLPVTAALCFGLHPINTESVNWISGRTDVMAGTFILLTTLYLLKFKKAHKKRFLVVSSLSLLLAALTKEVAMAFLPAFFLILTAYDRDNLTTGNYIGKTNRKLLPTVCLFLIVLALLYFLLRSGYFSSNTSNLGKTIKKIAADPNHALFVCLRAFGFYMKKLYAPFPLDFTIAEVDPLYELLALPLLLLCFLVALKRTLSAALFTAGILLIAPSLLVAFGNIAWMPYAERYVYVSSAFVVIPTAFFVRKRLEPLRNRTLIKAGVSVLLTILSLATLERNIYWMNTTPPYKDVKWLVEKDSSGK
ncbi:MAG TPA: hypothetical protein VI298_07420 [Geobacteraceae bacterium]